MIVFTMTALSRNQQQVYTKKASQFLDHGGSRGAGLENSGTITLNGEQLERLKLFDAQFLRTSAQLDHIVSEALKNPNLLKVALSEGIIRGVQVFFGMEKTYAQLINETYESMQKDYSKIREVVHNARRAGKLSVRDIESLVESLMNYYEKTTTLAQYLHHYKLDGTNLLFKTAEFISDLVSCVTSVFGVGFLIKGAQLTLKSILPRVVTGLSRYMSKEGALRLGSSIASGVLITSLFGLHEHHQVAQILSQLADDPIKALDKFDGLLAEIRSKNPQLSDKLKHFQELSHRIRETYRKTGKLDEGDLIRLMKYGLIAGISQHVLLGPPSKKPHRNNVRKIEEQQPQRHLEKPKTEKSASNSPQIRNAPGDHRGGSVDGNKTRGEQHNKPKAAEKEPFNKPENKRQNPDNNPRGRVEVKPQHSDGVMQDKKLVDLIRQRGGNINHPDVQEELKKRAQEFSKRINSDINENPQNPKVGRYEINTEQNSSLEPFSMRALNEYLRTNGKELGELLTDKNLTQRVIMYGDYHGSSTNCVRKEIADALRSEDCNIGTILVESYPGYNDSLFAEILQAAESRGIKIVYAESKQLHEEAGRLILRDEANPFDPAWAESKFKRDQHAYKKFQEALEITPPDKKILVIYGNNHLRLGGGTNFGEEVLGMPVEYSPNLGTLIVESLGRENVLHIATKSPGSKFMAHQLSGREFKPDEYALQSEFWPLAQSLNELGGYLGRSGPICVPPVFEIGGVRGLLSSGSNLKELPDYVILTF